MENSFHASKGSEMASFDFCNISTLLCGVSLLLGVCIGVLLEQIRAQTKSRSTIRVAESELVPDLIYVSSDNELPAVCNVLLVRPVKLTGFELAADIAGTTLFAIIGLSSTIGSEDNIYSSKPWSMMSSKTGSGSTSSSFLWTCSDVNGIVLRTSLFVKNSATFVLKLLIEQRIRTGLEGVVAVSEVIQTFYGGSVVVSRLCCDSSSLTVVKNDFLVVTTTSMLSDGTLLIASRSTYVPDTVTEHHRSGRMGFVRGVVYCSGFVLRPVESEDAVGCEVFFAAHVDMLGPIGESNSSKVEALYSSSLRMMEMIALCCSQDSEKNVSGNISGNVPASIPITAIQAGSPRNSVLTLTPNIAQEIKENVINKTAERPDDLPPFRVNRGQIKLSLDVRNNLHVASLSARDTVVHLYESCVASSDDQQGSKSDVYGSEGASEISKSLSSKYYREKDKREIHRENGERDENEAHWISSSTVTSRSMSLSPHPSPRRGDRGERPPVDCLEPGPKTLELAPKVPKPEVTQHHHGSVGSVGSVASKRYSTGGTGAMYGDQIDCSRGWDRFYDENGVTVSELIGCSTGGIVSAQCNLQCSPNDVRRLFFETPEIIEKKLISRSVLNITNEDASLQWLTYSHPAIFENAPPLGILEYLVIATVETFGRHIEGDEGFLIVTTSVDDLCEEGDDIGGSGGMGIMGVKDESAYCKNTVRARLGFLGVIGVPDGVGGTDLTVIKDTDHETHHATPEWLVRLYVQHELCEMIESVRDAVRAISPGAGDAMKIRVLGKFDSDLHFQRMRGRDRCDSTSTKSSQASTSAKIDRKGKNMLQKVAGLLISKQSRNAKTFLDSSEEKPPAPPAQPAEKSTRTARSVISSVLTGNMFHRAGRERSNSSVSIQSNQSDPCPVPPSSRINGSRSVVNNSSSGIKRSGSGVDSSGSPINISVSRINSSGSGVNSSGSALNSLESWPGNTMRRIRSWSEQSPGSDESKDSAFRTVESVKREKAGKTERTERTERTKRTEMRTVAATEPLKRPQLLSVQASTFKSISDDCVSGKVAALLSFNSNEDENFEIADEVLGPSNLNNVPSPDISSKDVAARRFSHPMVNVDTESVESEGNYDSVIESPRSKNLLSATGPRSRYGVKSTPFRDSCLAEAKELCITGFRLLKSYMTGCDAIAWQHKGAKRGVSVESTMVSGSTWQAIRAVVGMRSDKFSILQLLTDDGRMGEFDDMFDFATPLLKVDEHTNVRRLCFKPVWPTAPRDFLCCTTWEEQEDGSLLICSRSTSDALLLPQRGFVRGNIKISGYWIQPYHNLKPTDPLYCESVTPGCKVTLVAHTELGGNLPATVINMLSTAAPLKMMALIGDILDSDYRCRSVPNLPAYTEATSATLEGETSPLALKCTDDENLSLISSLNYSPREMDVSSGRDVICLADGSVIKKSRSSVDLRRNVSTSPGRRKGKDTCDINRKGSITNRSPRIREAKELCVSGFKLLKVYMGIADKYADSLTMDGGDECEMPLNIAWQHKGAKRGVSVESTMVSGSTWQAIRAVVGMRSDKFSILQLLTDDGRMGEFDDMFDFATPLLKVDEHTNVRRLCFKPVWPTAPRDFLCCTTWEEQEDGSLLICSRSTSDALLLPQRGFVRGNIKISGYWIQPYHNLKPTDPLYCESVTPGCKVTLVAHTELGGNLPATVINMLSTAAPLKMMALIGDIVSNDLKHLTTMSHIISTCCK